MDELATWNPLTDWKHTDVKWIKVDISRDDLRRFTKRSDLKGLCQSLGFLLVLFATGLFGWLYWRDNFGRYKGF
ncbi:MAG: hypothetical protein HQ559_12730 [Lentisphaerae bacterium]|nr:hypothetical protein [Lentisphaerota bacterium]